MLYPADPQPYGSGFRLNVNWYSREPDFHSLVSEPLVQTLRNDLAFLRQQCRRSRGRILHYFHRPSSSRFMSSRSLCGGPEVGRECRDSLGICPQGIFSPSSSCSIAANPWVTGRGTGCLLSSAAAMAARRAQSSKRNRLTVGYLAGWAAPNGGPLDAMDSAQAAAAIRYIYTRTACVASSCARLIAGELGPNLKILRLDARPCSAGRHA